MYSTGHDGCSERLHRRPIVSAAVLVAVVCLAASLLAALAGCGASSSSSSQTPPASTPPPKTATLAAIGPVWAQVGVDEAPLFGLAVIGAPGFTSSERRYLRDVGTAWSLISIEGVEYSKVPDMGSPDAAKLAKRIARQTAVCLKKSAPSKRFAALRESVRTLMGRVYGMAQLSSEYVGAQSADEKTTIVNKVVALGAPVPADVVRVADRGTDVRSRYGGDPGSSSVITTTPSATPTTSPTTSPTTNPTSHPTSEPTSTPTSTPKPSITKAEAAQIDDMETLDSWLTGILDSDSVTLSDPLPWDDAVVTSFCLDMGFIQDACDTWTVKKPAGSHVASGFKLYISGLKLVRAATVNLIDGAQTSSQSALNTGKSKLAKARLDLKKGMAALKALR
jgi:hypothetical protein